MTSVVPGKRCVLPIYCTWYYRTLLRWEQEAKSYSVIHHDEIVFLRWRPFAMHVYDLFISTFHLICYMPRFVKKMETCKNYFRKK